MRQTQEHENKKKEKAAPQEKQKVVSIKRAITQAQVKRATVLVPEKQPEALWSVVRSFSLTRFIDALQLRRAMSIQAEGERLLKKDAIAPSAAGASLCGGSPP